jgi:hypothetical protein
MKSKPPTMDNAYSVLRLSVAKLVHIREVQATGGGHFAQVARELGYVLDDDSTSVSDEELAWLEAQLAEAEQLRKRRSKALVQRLKTARDRLGVSSYPPPPGTRTPSDDES